MHMMNTAPTSSGQDGCKLPGFKDFLHELELKETGLIGPRPTNEISSTVSIKQLESYPSQNFHFEGPFPRPALLPTPKHAFLVPEPNQVPKSMGNLQLTCYENIRFALKSGPYHHSDSEKASGLPVGSFRTISPFRPGRCLQPLMLAPQGPRAKLAPCSYRPPAGRMASNDKHKQSEKHRRDEMGAYVQAADIIRGSLHPGMLFRCNSCIQDLSVDGNLCSSPTLPDNATGIAVGGASKKTKNQSIEEGLMLQFSFVLHLIPEEVGLRLDEIRALASQIWRENQIGKNSDFAKGNKWDADSRAEVLMEKLRMMRYACELHDVPPCACGKHEAEDWPMDTSGMLLTPSSPSSTTSPVVGQKRSRETTEEEGEIEESERVNRRIIARL